MIKYRLMLLNHLRQKGFGIRINFFPATEQYGTGVSVTMRAPYIDGPHKTEEVSFWVVKPTFELLLEEIELKVNAYWSQYLTSEK